MSRPVRGALAAVCAAAVVAVSLVGASSREAIGQAGATKRTGDAATGASAAHPSDWFVEREQHTYDGTSGYTLWRPDPRAESGKSPAMRVAIARELRPGQIDARVEERLSEYRDVHAEREEVRVGEKLKGVAIGPIPGSTPSTEVYVAYKGHVYQINIYGETLDDEGKKLLSGLRLEEPSRSVASAKLKDGKKAESFWTRGPEPTEAERKARRDAAAKAAAKAAKEGPIEEGTSGPTYRTMSSTPVYAEHQIEEGCWRADSRTYVQTPHGWGANSDPGDGIPTDFTLLGRPNFWSQYTHGSLGYGRCNSQIYTNDKYAVDLPYDRGNPIFSPFAEGVVVFAGRAYSHKNYGIMVVIRDSNGKYVNLSAHLDGLATGILKGKTVTADTVIGYAGNTGDPSIPVGEVHLHQAFYRYPRANADGTPYGGQGLQTVYHRYVGRPGVRAGGVYEYV